MSRKFAGPEAFASTAPYHLLPFRFIALDREREVLVSEVGDYVVCPAGTATRVAERSVERSEPLFADLASRHIVSDQAVPDLIDVLATRYRTKKSFLDGFTALHIFVLTLRCNHTCHYCQVSRQTEDQVAFDMSRDDIDRAVDLMFTSPSPSLTMEFQGGEPLLAFGLLQYAVERALEANEREGRDLTFVVCTNATAFSDEALAFLAEHRVLVSTSLDGPAHVHNANRAKSGADSYERVVEGIAAARAALGADRVSALMTTTAKSLDHPSEIVDAYVEHGFENVFLRHVSPYGFAVRSRAKNDYDTARFLDFYKAGLERVLEWNRRGVAIAEDYATIVLKKILTPFPVGYVDLQSPAGLISGAVVYNYDGGVYASDEARMLAEMGDDTFRLGSVRDSYADLFGGAVAQSVARHWSNEALAGCSDCGFQSFCGADPVFHHATQGDMEGYRPTSAFCARNMGVIRHLLLLLEAGGEDARTLRSWAAR